MAGISALLLAFPVGGLLPYAIHYALWFLFGCGAAFVLIHMVYGVFRIRPESAFLLLAFSTLLSCSIATFACMQSGRSLPAIICVLVLPVLALTGSRLYGCRQRASLLVLRRGSPRGSQRSRRGMFRVEFLDHLLCGRFQKGLSCSPLCRCSVTALRSRLLCS